MFEFLVFWFLLPLPGLALLRRAGGLWLDGGALSAIAASYLVSFALVTPVSVAGYMLGWPIDALSITVAIAILAAGVDLARGMKRWRLTRPSWFALIVFALLLADLVAGLRAGTHGIGDAHYHIARVRTLMTYGFVNWHPFLSGQHFDAVYHTNVYHALVASAAQLSGLEAFEAWRYLLPWSKVVIVGATEALALAVFRSRPLALMAAGAAVLSWAAMRITPYPNTFAMLWLVPFALARGIDLVSDEHSRRPALGIALAVVVLAQVHSLYYAFACLMLGPVLLGWAAFLWLRRGGARSAAKPLGGLLALTVGLPWLAVSAIERGHPEAPVPIDTPAQALGSAGTDGTPREPGRENWRYKGFLLPGGQRVVVNPSPMGNPMDPHTHLLAALGVTLLTTRRRAAAALLAMVSVVLAALYVPAICTLLVHLLGSPWILRRLDVILVLLGVALAPCMAGLIALERGWRRVWVMPLCAGFALTHGNAFATDSGRWTRREYVQRALDPERLQKEIRFQRRRADFLRAHVKPGGIIATSLGRAPEVPPICDCFPLAFEASYGMPGMLARRSALERIVASDTDIDIRKALLTRYGVQYVFVGNTKHTRLLKRAMKPLILRSSRSKAGQIFVLDILDPTK